MPLLAAVVLYCTPITDPRAGCILERRPVVAEVTQPMCMAAAQQIAAERTALHPGERIARLGCERRR